MIAYALKRLLFAIPLVLCVVLLVGSLIDLVPGSPVDLILGDYATEEDRAELMSVLGLDLPLGVRLLNYVTGIFTGDWGLSILMGTPVLEMIREHIFPTFILTVAAMCCAVAIGLPAGVYAAFYKGGAIDQLLMLGSLIFVSMPNFWLGPLLILTFSLWLDLLPVSEFGSLRGLILPAITLGGSLAGIIARMTRESFSKSMAQDFCRTAKAKGVSKQRVLWVHVLRHASIPVVTVLGLQFGALLTGAVVTEAVFDWPGMGTLMFSALSERDYPVVQGCVIVFSFTYIAINLMTDLVYIAIDPRMDLDRVG